MLVQTSRVSPLYQSKEDGNVNLCPKMNAFFFSLFEGSYSKTATLFM